MKIEIVQRGRVLKSYYHEGQTYVEAPPTGDYTIRLTNSSTKRRKAIVSVDGINVIDGETAGKRADGKWGPGYVLRARETINIPGWRRDNDKVARFTFEAQENSYSNQVGKGTSNTGVIGVAVFDEKEQPKQVTEEHHHHHHHYPWTPMPTWPQTQPFWWGTSDNTLGNPISTNGTNYGGGAPTTILNEVEGARKRPQMYGLTSEQVSGMSDDAIRSHLTEQMNAVRSAVPAGAAAASADPLGMMEIELDSGIDRDRLNETLSREIDDEGGPISNRRERQSLSSRSGLLRSRRIKPGYEPKDDNVNLGTGYGSETTMFVRTIEFETATVDPILIVQVQYATKTKLKSWGVPVQEAPPRPSAFPAAGGAGVPAPPGWEG